MDAKCKCFDGLDGAVSFRETFGETKVMQIRQGETLNYQGAITHEVCCLATQLEQNVATIQTRKIIHDQQILTSGN